MAEVTSLQQNTYDHGVGSPRLPARLAAALRIWALCVVGFTVVRVIIATRLTTTSFFTDPAGFFKAFMVGFVNDSLVAVVISLFVLVILGRLGRRRFTRVIAHALIVTQIYLILFGFIAEVVFWDEFASRFNGVAIYYLMFPREVIGTLQQSFDLFIILPLLLPVTLAFWHLNISAFEHGLSAEKSNRRRLFRTLRFLLIGAAPVILLGLMPLHSDENRELDSLAKNGLATIISALITNDADYEGVYRTMAKAEAIPILRSIVAQDNTTFLNPDGILRRVENGAYAKFPNIIMVTEESFGSVFMDSLDNELGISITPDLDRVAKDGLLFTNIYASGDRTVRGLEATETSFAPIPGISTARRPGAENMNSLPNLLKSFGYRSSVLYGGLAAFDNMGKFWKGIGFDKVLDQRDIRHESFSTIWGVSDEDLFTEALRRMDEQAAQGDRILLTLMTVSNHRPYKVPQTQVKWDDRLGRIQNTARYAQWAFVDFINRSRDKPWFDNTVFIFVGDHGLKVNGSAQVPVHSFRIPLLFYGPKFIQPGRVDTLGAQIDLIPTLLGLLGISYDSPFFGIDLMRVPQGGGRINIAHNFSIAYGRAGHVVVLEPNGDVLGYSFEPGEAIMETETPDPVILREAVAQTQEAHRMFYSGSYHWR